MLFPDGFGDVIFTVGAHGADDGIRTRRILAGRVKSGFIDYFDVAAGTGGPILLRPFVRGKSIARPAAAKAKKQQSRNNRFQYNRTCRFHENTLTRDHRVDKGEAGATTPPLRRIVGDVS